MISEKELARTSEKIGLDSVRCNMCGGRKFNFYWSGLPIGKIVLVCTHCGHVWTFYDGRA